MTSDGTGQSGNDTKSDGYGSGRELQRPGDPLSLINWVIFGILIKHRRLQKNLTQTSLAISCKQSDSYISQIESGKKKNVSLEVIEGLARALDIDPRDLIIVSMRLNAKIVQEIIKFKQEKRYNELIDLAAKLTKDNKMNRTAFRTKRDNDNDVKSIDILQFKLWLSVVQKLNVEHVLDDYFVSR